MNCTSPNYAIELGLKINGKKNLKMITVKQYELLVKGAREQRPNIVELPCGRCIACRLNYAKEWATRCMIEMKQWETNEMLTLTYDTEHLTYLKKIDLESGEVVNTESLWKKDLQDFWKRLRKKYPNIRYFACGEYGEKYGRPHFHAIVFNLKVEDKKLWHTNKKGNAQYTSKTIEKIWGKGKISLCEANYETAQYVARYIMKKQKGQGAQTFYETKNKKPEFTLMSRKPGIAREFYEKIKTNYEAKQIWLKTQKGMQKVKPPRYFDKIYDIEYPEDMKRIKEKRKELQEDIQRTMINNTDKNLEEYRQTQGDNLWAKMQQKLARNLKHL